MKRDRQFSTGLFFLMEQWVALLIGVGCLAVFLWTALDGYKAFFIWHLSHFSTAALASIGWLLTIAVGLIGVALMRIAFYKHSESKPETKSLSERARMTAAGSTKIPIA